MAASVIAILSDSSKESVGMSTAWVILSGTIPSAIPTTIPIVDPLVISTLPHTSPSLYNESSDRDTSERPPSQNPYEFTSSISHSCLPGQPIPIGRPYRTQPNGCVRYSPSDSFSGYSSDTSSSHSIPDSPFDTLVVIFARPSCKRCRSSTTAVPIATPVPRALSPTCADLLPPRKIIKGFVFVTDYEVSLEESYEPYIKPDIDSDVQADIDAGIAAADTAAAREMDVRVEDGIKTEAEAGEEANVEIQPEGTINIKVDVATKMDILDESLMPDVVERLGQLEDEHVVALKGSNMELRDALGIERVRADSLQRRLGYVEEELKHVRKLHAHETIKELISQRVDEALAAQEANHNAGLIDENQSQNRDDNDNGSRGNGNHGNNNGNVSHPSKEEPRGVTY
uniref:Uncharacterized protein n=1 Tax=Tanacetum cinerariifolium TaxID=118510 RepID=A0A6L2L3I8_TANCI|nr:hypothetical protein [Tanacetum cinerariifolium]